MTAVMHTPSSNPPSQPPTKREQYKHWQRERKKGGGTVHSGMLVALCVCVLSAGPGAAVTGVLHTVPIARPDVVWPQNSTWAEAVGTVCLRGGGKIIGCRWQWEATKPFMFLINIISTLQSGYINTPTQIKSLLFSNKSNAIWASILHFINSLQLIFLLTEV